ncbi:carbohydrate ABC transporter permease [Actinacidiphila sp. DG2A-62]|jgi:N,N'-diacetylchitobiose transport system permease protein|uniref:carbohydrate ABC transporter permease n=1 Tax=Actinacidiphila sp. DG2A-62 TaxID=3108821 RepID=UPI002DBC1699|nr:carbohydrate ABC transporter permease [Actinacidiphila sp. DG2A-62]MEC3996900.1 carbohydrate ABC transporter permease [Actinacidiphila sp. DG2A-62]
MSTAADTAAPAAEAPRVYHTKKKSRAGWNLLGLGVFVVMGFPVYWMIITALRPSQEILSYHQKLYPSSVTLDQFKRAMDMPNFWDNVKSSVIISVFSVVIAIGVGLLAAYAIGRFRFWGRRGLMITLLLVQMIPATSMLVPIYIQLNDMGGLNQYWGVIAVYAASTLPFSVWMLRGFIINIPRELEESAMVDGCGQMAAFRRVVLPLLAPGLVATAIYALMTAWNEYLFAYVLLQDNDKYTLSIWLLKFTGQRGTDYGALMAGSILIALPVVFFFLLVQRKVAAGLTAGAVKG